MAKAAKTTKPDPVQEAAVDYFAGRSHDAWRKQFLRANPDQKGKPRMRLRGGVMVDVNQPWSKLHARAREDNKRAARDAFAAIRRFPSDREAAADYVHRAWIKRNKSDPSQPKALFKPYASLPEDEKDKDRAHVDNMKKALAAVRAVKKPARAKAKPGLVTVRIDAKSWRRLQTAAAALSAAVGREVAPELLLEVGAEAATALAKAVASRSKRA